MHLLGSSGDYLFRVLKKQIKSKCIFIHPAASTWPQKFGQKTLINRKNVVHVNTRLNIAKITWKNFGTQLVCSIPYAIFYWPCTNHCYLCLSLQNTLMGITFSCENKNSRDCWKYFGIRTCRILFKWYWGTAW